MLTDGDKSGKYRAPALEKGLGILELLADARAPLTLAEICDVLGKSRNEIFRMVHVLERKRYIGRDGVGAYELTNKLFALGMTRPLVRDLSAAARVEMATLAIEIGQSCHLAIAAEGRISVILRAASPHPVSFSVRAGYTGPIARTTSGKTLYAFQPDDIRSEWLDIMRAQGQIDDEAAFHRDVETIAAVGFAHLESDFVRSVIDIAAPVMEFGRAVAVLAVPFMHMRIERQSIEESVQALLRSTRAITARLAFAEHPSG